MVVIVVIIVPHSSIPYYPKFVHSLLTKGKFGLAAVIKGNFRV